MIHLATSLLQTGRAAPRAAGARRGAAERAADPVAGQEMAVFASLFEGREPADGEVPAEAGPATASAATDRHDDAATGNPAPPTGSVAPAKAVAASVARFSVGAETPPALAGDVLAQIVPAGADAAGANEPLPPGTAPTGKPCATSVSAVPTVLPMHRSPMPSRPAEVTPVSPVAPDLAPSAAGVAASSRPTADEKDRPGPISASSEQDTPAVVPTPLAAAIVAALPMPPSMLPAAPIDADRSADAVGTTESVTSTRTIRGAPRLIAPSLPILPVGGPAVVLPPNAAAQPANPSPAPGRAPASTGQASAFAAAAPLPVVSVAGMSSAPVDVIADPMAAISAAPVATVASIAAATGPDQRPVQTARHPSMPEPLARGTGQGIAVPPVSTPTLAAVVPSASGTIAPAGQVFAAAIHAAGLRRPNEPRDGDLAAQATPDGGDASLDMRHPGWPAAMVDHIEKLRDAADATDTRIRVVPDALGSIDLSISRHDDGVRVTLAADQPATQAMLADARPQLTEMAQARGIRLADAPVGGSAQGFADGQSQRQPPPGFMASAPAPTIPTDDDPDPADRRVA